MFFGRSNQEVEIINRRKFTIELNNELDAVERQVHDRRKQQPIIKPSTRAN
jgi:hypothetical protein